MLDSKAALVARVVAVFLPLTPIGLIIHPMVLLVQRSRSGHEPSRRCTVIEWLHAAPPWTHVV